MLFWNVFLLAQYFLFHSHESFLLVGDYNQLQPVKLLRLKLLNNQTFALSSFVYCIAIVIRHF